MKISEILERCIDRINKFGWRDSADIDGDDGDPAKSCGPLCVVWTIDAVTQDHDEYTKAKVYINRVLIRPRNADLASWSDSSTQEIVLETLAKARDLAKADE